MREAVQFDTSGVGVGYRSMVVVASGPPVACRRPCARTAGVKARSVERCIVFMFGNECGGASVVLVNFCNYVEIVVRHYRVFKEVPNIRQNGKYLTGAVESKWIAVLHKASSRPSLVILVSPRLFWPCKVDDCVVLTRFWGGSRLIL